MTAHTPGLGPDPDFVLAALATLMEPTEDVGSVDKAEALLARMAGAFMTAPATAPHAAGPSAPDAAPPPDDAVVVTDDRGVIVAFNRGAEALFGHEAAGVVGQRVASLVDGPRGRRRDGSVFSLDVSTSQVALDGRRATVLVLHDRDARLRAEEELRRSQTRYRMLVEQIPAVTFMANLGEGINEIYIGPQIETLLGFTQQEWLENPVIWYWQLHPEDRARWCAEFARGCQTGGPFRSECRFIARDGRVVWLHGEARVIRDDAGRPIFIQGVAFDITESKLAEQKLREAQEVRARNERLAAIGQLAGGVAHDLRNPLGAIRNAWFFIHKRLHGLEAWQKDEKVKALGGVVDAELGRCGRIIGDLLDFARDRPPFRVACPLPELVRDALSVVVRPAPSIRLEEDVPQHLPVPYLDRDQVRQVLVNLAQNAVEAVDPATGRVVVVGRGDGDGVVIEVKDDGRGMPPEVRAKLFEPLFTTKTKGTGLGLAIVANMVKRHGGTVTCDSAPGRGTTFSVRLPLGAPSTGERPMAGGAADLRSPVS